ncbi:hypothetical protein Y032_0160g3333 [Ancylostoma ceylanicum]|uniref:Uncharacterized protein n=1 Tax=Ancylostoma ceylanicum TaxID=53326 RepID=A0A016SYD2_9BILA|nr:hypothetical protein Y032_0160g3333 [Ancylostoma ceylanicum]
MSKERVEYVVNNFLHQGTGSKFVHASYKYCRLPLVPDPTNQRLELRFPCRESYPTSSVFAAFIIRVMRQYALERGLDRGHMDFGFYKLFLQSSKIVEYMCSTRKGLRDNLSLLSEESLSTAIKYLDNETLASITIPQRIATDRVTSAILWRMEMQETILMLNLGSPLDSKKRPSDGTSAASIMVVDTSHDDNPIIVASASGSVRTVEAVASVVLRMLLFDESPAEAIRANASFYDFQQGTFFCENTNKLFRAKLEAKSIRCESTTMDYSKQHDRIAMAARRQKNGRLVAAVDQRPEPFWITA